MFLGASSLVDFKLGALQVERIYLGANEVWNSSGGLDADAVAFAAATGATDITFISLFFTGLKDLGFWDTSVFHMMKLDQNYPTGTAIKSAGGLGSFDAIAINGASKDAEGMIFDGINDYVEFNNPLKTTALSNYSMFAIFKSDIGSAGQAVIGSYNGTAGLRGPQLFARQSPMQGGTFDGTKLFQDLTVDGTTQIVFGNAGRQTINLAVTGEIQSAAAIFRGDPAATSALWIYSNTDTTRGQSFTPPTTAWNNNDKFRIGARIDNGYYFKGNIAFTLVSSSLIVGANYLELLTLYKTSIGASAAARAYVEQGFDANAAAYIAAVEAAAGMAPITTIQKDTINNFIVTEKEAGRWSRLRRFYLPIWGNYEANKICMRSLSTQAITSGVTHVNNGYIETTSTSGYYSIGVNFTQTGVFRDHCIGNLQANIFNNSTLWGSGAVTPSRVLETRLGGTAGVTTGRVNAWAAAYPEGTDIGNQNGIVMMNLVNDLMSASNRSSTGFTNIYADKAVPYTGGASGAPFMFLARNNSNSGTYSPAYGATGKRAGGFFISLSMDEANRTEFSLKWKDLWETCTGLTLP
jgi:hypothetical protein